MNLIDKDALVTEINQRVEDYKSHNIDDSYHDGLIFALEDLRDDFIDTLEVKEVDLEKEYEKFVVDDPILGNFITNDTMGIELAKHFFELGMAVNSKLIK